MSPGDVDPTLEVEIATVMAALEQDVLPHRLEIDHGEVDALEKALSPSST